MLKLFGNRGDCIEHGVSPPEFKIVERKIQSTVGHPYNKLGGVGVDLQPKSSANSCDLKCRHGPSLPVELSRPSPQGGAPLQAPEPRMDLLCLQADLLQEPGRAEPHRPRVFS